MVNKKDLTYKEIEKACDIILSTINALCITVKKYRKRIDKIEAENADLRKAMK